MEDKLIVRDLNTQEITVSQGSISFPEYENLKLQASELAAEIAQIEVNDENIKQSKKMLAEVNKAVKDLDDRRIKIKKVLLEPYIEFECQVKEIVNIVKEADEIVRTQVKALEESERTQKEKHLRELFEKRIVHYSFRDLFGFGDFLKPKHLNKSTSIDSIEKEMIEFLEKLAREMNAIEKMEDAQSILSLYVDVKDLAAAITLHEQQKARKQQIEALQAQRKPMPTQISYLVSISVHNQKELALIEMLLKANDFEYQVDKIEKEVF